MYTALGLGAVLMQQDACGEHRAVAYASRTLNKAGLNYSVTHHEILAVVWDLKHFLDMILGCPKTVFTEYATVIKFFKGGTLQVNSRVGT